MLLNILELEFSRRDPAELVLTSCSVMLDSEPTVQLPNCKPEEELSPSDAASKFKIAVSSQFAGSGVASNSYSYCS